MKLEKCTRDEYLNLTMNPELNLKIVDDKRGLQFTQTVFNGLEVIAKRVILPSGVTYHKAKDY